MANDNSKNSPPEMSRQRRSSVSNPLTNLLRSGPGATAFPSPINDQRRRLSITTLGLPGTSPTTTGAVSGSPFLGLRRGSISTNNSDAIDENAVEDDEPTSARTAPTTPFTRHMSFGTNAMRNLRMPPGASPGGSNDQGFNWPEQLRSRAESIAAGARPTVSYATSPPRGNAGAGAASMQSSGPRHDRAKSVSDMPAPPAQTPKPRPQKPDHFQERILKGDFYMD